MFEFDAGSRIIVELDFDRSQRTAELVDGLAVYGVIFKLDLVALCRYGSVAIDYILAHNGRVYCAGHFHDTPETVAGAVRAIVASGAHFFSVQAAAGVKALQAASLAKGEAKLIAIATLLDQTVDATNLSLVRQANLAGADIIHCTAGQLRQMKYKPKGQSAQKLVGKIQPVWYGQSSGPDFLTPTEAIECGADYLLIKEPLTNPPPAIGTCIEAVEKIIDEMTAAQFQQQQTGQGAIASRLLRQDRLD